MNDPLIAYTLHLSNHSFPLFMKRQICFLIPYIVLLTLGNCFIRGDAYGYIFAGLFYRFDRFHFWHYLILYWVGNSKTNEIEMFFSLSLPLLLSCFRMVACPSTKM